MCKNPQRPAARSWIHPGSPPGTSSLKGRKKFRFLEACLLSLRRGESGENHPDSVVGDLKMKLHLCDPLTSLAFSKGKQAVTSEGRTGVSLSFMGLGFRRLLCSRREIKDKTLYEPFITLITISFHE